jgi:putative membrane protein
MDLVMNSLSGLLNFGLYFTLSLVLLLVFKFAYTLVTPHDEWKLVKEQHNVAAALGLVGAIIGFALALGSAASHSVSLVDFLIWALVALVAQTIAFALVRFLLMPRLVQRITDNEIPAGIILGGTSIAVGILNAACMTY